MCCWSRIVNTSHDEAAPHDHLPTAGVTLAHKYIGVMHGIAVLPQNVRSWCWQPLHVSSCKPTPLCVPNSPYISSSTAQLAPVAHLKSTGDSSRIEPLVLSLCVCCQWNGLEKPSFRVEIPGWPRNQRHGTQASSQACPLKHPKPNDRETRNLHLKTRRS